MLEGTLTQGAEVEHSRVAHGAGQAIENVEICALNVCSTTDGNGRWGFLAESFSGGTVMISIQGHGIDARTPVEVPADARDMIVELVNLGENTVRADSVIVNGTEVVSHEDHDT